MLLREFLGIRRADETERSAAWIRSQQRADGTWANFFEGPGDLSTTIEAYWALRLAGDEPHAEHMRMAGRVHPRAGGHRAGQGLHPPVAGAVRPLVLGAGAGTSPGGDPAGPAGPAERLRLRLLGPSDDRRAGARQSASAGPQAGVRPARAVERRRARPANERVSRAAPILALGLARAAWTGCCASTSATRSRRCAGSPAPGRSAGSSAARRPTAPGAGSSRRGSIR